MVLVQTTTEPDCIPERKTGNAISINPAAHEKEPQAVWALSDDAMQLDLVRRSHAPVVREGTQTLFPSIPADGQKQAFMGSRIKRQTGRVANMDNLSIFLGVGAYSPSAGSTCCILWRMQV